MHHRRRRMQLARWRLHATSELAPKRHTSLQSLTFCVLTSGRRIRLHTCTFGLPVNPHSKGCNVNHEAEHLHSAMVPVHSEHIRTKFLATQRTDLQHQHAACPTPAAAAASRVLPAHRCARMTMVSAVHVDARVRAKREVESSLYARSEPSTCNNTPADHAMIEMPSWLQYRIVQRTIHLVWARPILEASLSHSPLQRSHSLQQDHTVPASPSM